MNFPISRLVLVSVLLPLFPLLNLDTNLLWVSPLLPKHDLPAPCL